MTTLLIVLLFALFIAIAAIVPGYGAAAVLVCIFCSLPVVIFINRSKTDKEFLLKIFVAGLLFRVLTGAVIFIFALQGFFGGDALTYDFFGYVLLQSWSGQTYYDTVLAQYSIGGGWGMLYEVAAIYSIVGRNMLAVQLFNAIIGASTAHIIYLCAKHIFSNIRVARVAALCVAFYPSLVLWSSQGLKDGPIMFLLAVSMLATLKLGQRFQFGYVLVLIGALFGLLSLRFYIFYMVVTAIAGAFVIGMRAVTAQSFMRQLVIIMALGFAFTYLGVARYATIQYETFGNLDAVQRSRLDAAQSGQSGFDKGTDVTTVSGAISALPTGFIYLMLAPFPWQLASLRQSITLPEMIIWWASIPLLIVGLIFTYRYRLRQASPVIIFTIMLTLSYSLFQGNVGNVYRQRGQLLIFFFIFVAVGFILLKERREERRRRELALRNAAPIFKQHLS